MEDNRSGQLNNDGGAGQSDALNSVGIGTGQSNQGGQFGQTEQNSQGDDTLRGGQNFKQNNLNKEEIEGLGEREQEKVVSLKGEITQSEIEKKRRIEAMKAGAVKLEGKKTKKELEKAKELEKLKAKALKLSPIKKSSDLQSTQGEAKKIEKNITAGQAPDDLSQQVQKREIVDDLSLRNKVVDKSQNKNRGDSSMVADGKNVENGNGRVSDNENVEKEKQRMVISPDGKISWEGLANKKNVVNLKADNKSEPDSQKEADISGGKIVNLKENVETVVGNKKRVSEKSDKTGMSFEKNIKANERVDSGQNKQIIDNQGKDELGLEDEQKIWEKEKVDLSGLSADDRIKLQATPSLASVNKKMDDDTNWEMTKWFEEYNKLPVNIKLGLGNGDVRQAVLDLARKFGLKSEEELGEISRIIRDVYVNLIGENEIRRRVVDILKISSDKVDDFLKGIALIVALVKEMGTEKSSEYFEKLSVDEILERYPKIAEKDVTVGQITEKNSDKEVEPTLKNWLNDYISRAGADKHNNLERGKYLADSPNIKNLDKDDRKKIEMLARSYDEGIKLVVDPESENILWQLHTDESALGINTDKEKRVINHFKIDEAQTVDVDNFMNRQEVVNKNNAPEVDLRNKPKDSIMEDKEGKEKEGVLDLSSEIKLRDDA